MSNATPNVTYEGSCHCGAVRFNVTMEPPAKAYACNCSLCSRAGWLLAFTPAASFELQSGEDHLTDYQFNKRALHHTFCKTCGVRPFSSGTDKSGEPVKAVNLRCLAGFDATGLPVHTFDGASL
jgi:hypothetical protein